MTKERERPKFKSVRATRRPNGTVLSDVSLDGVESVTFETPGGTKWTVELDEFDGFSVHPEGERHEPQD